MEDITFFKSKNTIFLKPVKTKAEIKEQDNSEGYFIASSEKEARKIIDSLKQKKKVIAVLGKDDAFNRRAIETLKINFLISPEYGEKKDTLKQTDSGLNHVITKIAKEKNISIVINMQEIMSMQDKKSKAKKLARIMQNIKICRKTGCKIKIASFASSPKEIISKHNRKAFGFSLGMSSQQASDCC